MIEVKGFSCGWSGSSGGAHRREGQIQGQKGQGRSSTVRTYTINVKRLSDGKELRETVGPAYWHKKKWHAEQEAAQKRLLKQLGWNG